MAPVIIICGAIVPAVGAEMLSVLLQNAMFIAGIATAVQLFPIWKIGARLPIVMGVSFTFVAILCAIASVHGPNAMVGAVIVGGLFEGMLGFFARYWRRFITPIVAASVVTAIGISLFSVGTRSFGGGYAADFGALDNLFLGSITLVTCIIWLIFAKGHLKQLSVLGGLAVGYIGAIIMDKVDYSAISSAKLFAIPDFMPFTPEFNLSAIVSVCIIFMVSAAETIGDTSALASAALKRDPTNREISGALSCDGLASAVSGCFGVSPLTSFSQNIGLVAMTGVVNRFTILTGAGCMILAGLVPAVGQFFATVPQSVLGGCTIIMFGQIVLAGIEMISKCGFSQRNIIICSMSLSIGIGFTASTEQGLWQNLPEMMREIFEANVVAIVFVIAIVLNLILPKKMDIKKK